MTHKVPVGSRSLFAAASILAAALPSVASANPADMFGIGGRAMGMGAAYTAVSNDSWAAYYNMAGVGQLHKKELSFALQLGSYYFGDRDNCFDTSERAGCSEPFYYQNGGAWEVQQLRYGYENPHNLQIGAAVPLHRKVTLGVGVAMPVDVKYSEDGQFQGVGVRLARLQTIDPYLPHYAMYRNRANVFGIYAGLGIEAAKGLYFGIGSSVASGAYLNLTMGGDVITTTVTDPVTHEETAQIVSAIDPQMEMGLTTSSSLVGGALWDLGMLNEKLEGFRLGASYRGPTSVSVDSNIGTDLNITLDMSEDSAPVSIPVQVSGIMMQLADFYTPRQATLGLAGHVGKNFTAAVDVTWTQWSAYKLPVALISMGTSEDAASAGGLVTQPGRTVPAGMFYDTVVPHLGVEQKLGPFGTAGRMRGIDLAVRGGASYEPNPIITQDSYTNLLNADRVTGTLGLGATASNALKGTNGTRPLSVDMFFQWHQLVPEVHQKDPAKFDSDDFQGTQVLSDGYPLEGKYVAQGRAIIGGVNATVKF